MSLGVSIIPVVRATKLATIPLAKAIALLEMAPPLPPWARRVEAVLKRDVAPHLARLRHQLAIAKM